MKRHSGILGLVMLAGLLAAKLPAATILFDVTDLGGGVFRYNYAVSGLSLLQGQELDISFDPAVYASLSNGVAPNAFDLLLFQPGSPPGAKGVYSAAALVNHPPLTGTFSVDFTLTRAGRPGPQPYTITSFDTDGMHTVESGSTVPAVPEVGNVFLSGTGLLICGLFGFVRRHCR